MQRNHHDQPPTVNGPLQTTAIYALGDFYEAGLEKLVGINLNNVPPAWRPLAFFHAIVEQGHDLWKNGCLIGALASAAALAEHYLIRVEGAIVMSRAHCDANLSEADIPNDRGGWAHGATYSSGARKSGSSQCSGW